MPIPSNPPFLPNVLGYSADANSIPATTPVGSGAFSYQSAFPPITSLPLLAGGIAPMREDFNAAFKLLSQHTFFQQSGCVYLWSSSLDYPVGSHVLGSDDVEYVAIENNGPDYGGAVNPTTDELGETWQCIVTRAPNQIGDGSGGGSGGGSGTAAVTTLYVDYTKAVSGNGLTAATAFSSFSDCFAAIRNYQTINGAYNSTTMIPNFLIIATGNASNTIETSNWYFQGMDITIQFQKNFILQGSFSLYSSTCFLTGTGKFTIYGMCNLDGSSLYIQTNFTIQNSNSAPNNNSFYAVSSNIRIESGCNVTATASGPTLASLSMFNVFGNLSIKSTGGGTHTFASCDIFVNSSSTLVIDTNAQNHAGAQFTGGTVRVSGTMSIAYPYFLGTTAQINLLKLGSSYSAPQYGLLVQGAYVGIAGSVSSYTIPPQTKGMVTSGGTVQTAISSDSWPGSGAWQITGNGYYGT